MSCDAGERAELRPGALQNCAMQYNAMLCRAKASATPKCDANAIRMPYEGQRRRDTHPHNIYEAIPYKANAAQMPYECNAVPCHAVQAKALEQGELRPGALVPTEALMGCLFPCASSSPSGKPLFSSSILAPRSGRPLDRFVGVTDKQVLELEAHRTRMNQVGLIE